MFWSKKVECDGCATKLKESEARYYRGSYFCGDACREQWASKNPPLIARGEPDKIKRDLVMTIDAAMDEYRKSRGITDPVSRGVNLVVNSVPVFGGINAQHQAQDRAASAQQFRDLYNECLPMMTALGYREEVDAIFSIKPGTAGLPIILRSLETARARAAS